MFAIERLRKDAGLSQVELANALKVTQGAISQWEKGSSIPSSDKLPEIAKVLGCTVDDLYDEQG